MRLGLSATWEEGGSFPGRPSAQLSARRCAEPAAPVPAPLLAGAGVRLIWPEGKLSPHGVVARRSHPVSVAELHWRLLVSAAHLSEPGSLCRVSPPSGARRRACVSKHRLGQQRELGRPCPCRVELLQGRGDVSQARSPQRFPRRSCPFCKVPLSSAASVGRLGPRGDETRPCPGGAPGPLRETVHKHDNGLSRGHGSAEVEFCLRKPQAQEGSQGCPSSRNKSGTEPFRVWIWKNHYWEGNSGVKMA